MYTGASRDEKVEKKFRDSLSTVKNVTYFGF